MLTNKNPLTLFVSIPSFYAWCKIVFDFQPHGRNKVRKVAGLGKKGHLSGKCSLPLQVISADCVSTEYIHYTRTIKSQVRNMHNIFKSRGTFEYVSCGVTLQCIKVQR